MILPAKQYRFIEAVYKKLREMDNLEPEIITHDSYEWHKMTLKGFGTIPKLTFGPYGKGTKIKAEIMRSANLLDESRHKEIEGLRRKFNFQKARDHEDRILARLFESYWNSYWKGVIRALYRIEQAQKLFIKPNETISEPIQILMGKSLPNSSFDLKSPQKPDFPDIKPYDAILAELE